MSEREIAATVGRVVGLATRIGWTIAQLTARAGAQLITGWLPAANSPAEAGVAALIAWCVGTAPGALLFLSGDPALGLIGVGCGAIVGALMAHAVHQRATAQMTAVGAVQYGEHYGALDLVQPSSMPRELRLRHLWVTGPTGAGKSTLVKNLVRQDLLAPGQPGVMVVDVKDDLVLDICAQVPPERLDDVLLFDPADREFPPAFNPLAGVPPEGRSLAAAEVISALKRLFADAWGVRLEHILRVAVLTLLETPNATLLDIGRVLTDPDYRAWALEHLTNPGAHDFWEHEFPAIVGGRGSLGAVEPILNKLSILANYPEVRNIIGRPERGLDIRGAMDEGKVILANLPQGILGEDIAFFLAALLVGKVQLAAQSRVTLPQGRRRPFYLFVDEFQNYTSSAFDKLVTEGRSLGLGLTMANQFREQLPSSLRLVLERNCALALACGIESGRHTLSVVKLQELHRRDAVTELRPLPPPAFKVSGQLEAVRARSRSVLGAPRTAVEAAISARSAMPAGASNDGSSAASSDSESEEGRPGRPRRRSRARVETSSALKEAAGDGRVFE